MKPISLIFLIALFSNAALAQTRLVPDGMGGWTIQSVSDFSMWGPAQSGARLYEMDRQNQLLQQQQIENQRLQNEILRRKLEQDRAASQTLPQQAPQVTPLSPELTAWKLENPWFESDRPKTEFALIYAKQLRQERPDLVGRPFLDAISAKINETFAVAK